jgi:pyochelin biosynthetic protein PchC
VRQSTLRFPEHDAAVRTWLHPGAPPPRRAVLCFPFSGGSSTAFRPLAQALGPAWAVHAVDPPGHGLGAAGPVIEDVPTLVSTYRACLDPSLLEGALLLGFSLGGYVAHHLAVALADAPRPPAGLVLCSVPPYEGRTRRYSDLPDEDLFRGLMQLGGIPRGLSEAASAFSMFAHVVRADFRAYEDCPAPGRRLALPTLVLVGAEDPICPTEGLEGWSAAFSSLETGVVQGSHIFLTDHADALAGRLEAFGARLGL